MNSNETPNTSVSSGSPSIPYWIVYGLVVVSFIGFLDALYLTAEHYRGVAVVCSFFEGCGAVTSSKYAVLFGFPISLYGVFFYLAVFYLSILYLDRKLALIFRILPYLTGLAFVASVTLIYLQVFVLNAICFYCLLSALSSTALFILSLFASKYLKGAR
jgi:uncharacterized membrane protein